MVYSKYVAIRNTFQAEQIFFIVALPKVNGKKFAYEMFPVSGRYIILYRNVGSSDANKTKKM